MAGRDHAGPTFGKLFPPVNLGMICVVSPPRWTHPRPRGGNRSPGCKVASWSCHCLGRRMGARRWTWLMRAIHRGSSVWS